LNWDEGPLVGGPFGPYIQTERGDIYREVVGKLLAAKLAYRCFCTREEIEAREAARPMGAPSGYDGFCRNLSEQRISELDALSVPSVVRMRVPDADIAFDDLVRGPVRFAAAHVPDYVIVRSNGEPLYTLVNPLDDSLMEITHVLRGERPTAVNATPDRALRRAVPNWGRQRTHPVLRSSADGAGRGQPATVQARQGIRPRRISAKGLPARSAAELPRLLGWAIAEDRDVFAIAEMVEAFDIRRVNANPARFDARKCEAINAAHIRLLPPDELTANLIPFFAAAGLIGEPARPGEHDRLAAATPLIQERINTLSEAVSLLAFLFLPDDKITIAADAGLVGRLHTNAYRRRTTPDCRAGV
jgi:glutamyl-tRNA synthetase